MPAVLFAPNSTEGYNKTLADLHDLFIFIFLCCSWLAELNRPHAGNSATFQGPREVPRSSPRSHNSGLFDVTKLTSRKNPNFAFKTLFGCVWMCPLPTENFCLAIGNKIILISRPFIWVLVNELISEPGTSSTHMSAREAPNASAGVACTVNWSQ